MKIFLNALLAMLFSTLWITGSAQSFYRYDRGKDIQVIIGAGLASYSGELSATNRFETSNFNVSVGAQLKLNNRIGVRGEILWYRISGADSDSDPSTAEGRVQRNLSFTAENFEINVAPVLYLLPEKSFSINPNPFNLYVTAGIGVTYFNPKAEFQGKLYKLRPLKTEGVEYNQYALVFPVGVGLKYKANNNISLVLEANYRFTFTDYLDDVSTIYRAQSSFADPVAASLADRSQELGFKPFAEGSQRGNPDANDGYLITTLKVSYHLPYKDNRIRRIR